MILVGKKEEKEKEKEKGVGFDICQNVLVIEFPPTLLGFLRRPYYPKFFIELLNIFSR
jgi:hypothetical protein